MIKFKVILFLLPILVAQIAYADPNEKTKATPSYDVVAEYIRSLGSIYGIQKTAIKEQQEANANKNPYGALMNSIRGFTALKLELNYSANRLENMSVKREGFDELIPTTIYFYKEKIKLYEEATDISKKILVATEEDVSSVYQMAARIPEITAKIDYLDQSIFESMPLVFALLIDEKPDKEGHMSHLNTTKEQRNKLIYNIDVMFGDSLNKKDKNWTVSSAALLKGYLQKNYICKDDWEKTQ